jgi:hypothetical protein
LNLAAGLSRRRRYGYMKRVIDYRQFLTGKLSGTMSQDLGYALLRMSPSDGDPSPRREARHRRRRLRRPFIIRESSVDHGPLTKVFILPICLIPDAHLQ